MKLSRKQAFELSIKKWEALARGEDVPDEILDLQLLNGCGLCEKYYHTNSNELSKCAKCPIRPDLEDYDDINIVGCDQNNHPWIVWSYHRTPENAQKVLDLIKSKL
jgi:hypothetical protein